MSNQEKCLVCVATNNYPEQSSESSVTQSFFTKISGMGLPELSTRNIIEDQNNPLGIRYTKLCESSLPELREKLPGVSTTIK